MKEFPLRSVCKICVGSLRGQDAPAKTACATGRLLLGKGKKNPGKYSFLSILYTEFCKDSSEMCILFFLVLDQLRSRSKTQG